MNRSLAAYRAMAYVVGVLLIVLVFVGVPLQFGAGHPAVVNVVGPIHGFFYIVYLLTAANLARRERFSLKELLAIVAAGLLPFLAFIIERRVTKRITSRHLVATDPVASETNDAVAARRFGS
jgi:integral membrane protein